MEEFEKLVSESFQSDLLPADDGAPRTSDQNRPDSDNIGLTENGTPSEIKTAS
jgi:hypothetical protein